METKEEVVSSPPAKKHHHDNDNDIESVIAAHRSLHRFMMTLLEDAAVSALQTILIQDNASILTKSASLSARAAHQRLALGGRDHMIITKEISRWESYPFEVDKPIVVNKPKRAKNGCVPQRRAKRRSGLESAGEIKADILKKAESLPRRPRRRSSVANDEAQKSTMQEELLSLFEDDDTITSGNSSCSSNNKAIGRSNASRPKRDVSPCRWAMIPKKPIRRPSEIPDDLTSNDSSASNSNLNTRQPTRSNLLADLMGDSQHSIASTETTLSEIAARQSDLSSISEQTTELLTTLAENRPVEFSMIREEEEEDHQHHPLKSTHNQDHEGSNSSNNNTKQTMPRKPMRRVSEVPDSILGPMPRSSSNSFAQDEISPIASNSMAKVCPPPASVAPPSESKTSVASEQEQFPSLSANEFPSVDLDEREPVSFEEDDDDYVQDDASGIDPSRARSPARSNSNSNGSNTNITGGSENRKVSRNESMPKKPTRRGSEAPQNHASVASVGHHSPLSGHRAVSPVKPEIDEISGISDGRNSAGSEAQHSFSAESTASETTVASDGSTAADETAVGTSSSSTQQPMIRPTGTHSPDCAVIPEEECNSDTRSLQE